MKNALLLTAVLCLSGLTAASLAVLGSFNRLCVDADLVMKAEQKDLHGTSQNLNAILIQAGLAADQARLAALEQRHYWNRTAIETDKTVKAARKLIVNVDRQVTGETLPAVTDAVTAIRYSAEDIQYGMSTALAAMPPVLQSANRTIEDVDKLAINPEWTSTLHNVQGITANVHETTGLVNAWVARETKPPSLAMRLLGLGADLAPGGYGIYRAVHP